MRNFIFLFFVFNPIISFGQYSDYYRLDINTNSNVNYSGTLNVRKNIDVTGNVNVNKTIRTIDYGALRLANAQREKNRLTTLIYDNEENRRKALEIAVDPSKAFDYGQKISFKTNRKYAKYKGAKQIFINYNSLFEVPFKRDKSIGFIPSEYSNFSVDFITSTISDIDFIVLTKEAIENFEKVGVKSSEAKTRLWAKFLKDLAANKNLESSIKNIYINDYGKVGSLNFNGEYIHKTKITRTRINGISGFKVTIIKEDEYEKSIDNTFFGYDRFTNVFYGSDFIIKGSKNEVDFETLEGRNEYFRLLTDKFFSQEVYTIIINK